MNKLPLISILVFPLFEFSLPHQVYPPYTPDELMIKMTETYTSLQSYELNLQDSGYNTFFKDRQQKISKHYAQDMQKHGQKAEAIRSDPTRMEATFTIKYRRPFAISMKILETSFLPSVLFKTRVFYRSERGPEYWRVIPSFLPLVTVRRSVQKHDPGRLFTMGWIFSFLIIDKYKNFSDQKIRFGQNDYGQDCYILELFPRMKSMGSLEFRTEDLRKWGFPEPLLNKVLVDLQPLKKERPEKLVFWVDAQSFLLLKTERYVDGQLFWTTEFRDIKLNGLTEKDF
jgi:hypothetical protein